MNKDGESVIDGLTEKSHSLDPSLTASGIGPICDMYDPKKAKPSPVYREVHDGDLDPKCTTPPPQVD